MHGTVISSPRRAAGRQTPQLKTSTVGGNTTTYNYDAIGRQKSVVDPLSGTTTYSYDLAGNMLSLTDPSNNTTTWSYDGLNRVTTDTNQLGASRTYQYDANGNLIDSVDRNGRVISYQYDNLNRQTSETWQPGNAAVSVVRQGSGGRTDTVQDVVMQRGATGGSWTLSVGGQPTGAIDYNATAAGVQTALDNLLAGSGGSATVTGAGTDASPFVVTFGGSLAGTIVSEMGVDFSGLSGTNIYDQTGTGVSMQAYGAMGTNEVQVVGYAATGSTPVASGSYTLAFDGQTTDPIAYDASADAVRQALEKIVGAGNVVVSGPTGAQIAATGAAMYKITFINALGGQAQPAITIDSSSLQDQNGLTSDVDLLAWIDVQGSASTYAVQQVTVTGNTTFQLAYQGQSTGDLSVGATDAQVKTALEALPGISQVDVTGSGTTADPYLITFQGNLAGGSVALLTGSAAAATDTILSTYDAAGQLKTASDAFSSYTYSYDKQGRVASVDNSGTPGVPDVLLTSQYDTIGNRSQLTAAVAGTADFVNNYTYDALSRLTQVTQDQQTGGNAVAPKGLQFGYNSLSDLTGIQRYTDLTAGPNSATDPADTTLSYDNTTGQLQSIDSSHNGAPLDNLGWTYDSLGRVATFTSSVDGTATYNYDTTNQVTGSAYTTNAGATQPSDESYTYDANGNRTKADGNTVTPGTNNQLANDGTFTYQYDAEGNRTKRTRISGAQANDYKTTYTWDYRNRLTDVNYYDNSNTLTKHVHYIYDVFDHLIGEQIDSTGAGSFDQTARYVYDGNDVVLQFDDAGSLTNRYLSAPGASGVDVVMAQEAVSSPSAAGTVTWPLTDNLGSVRDVVDATGAVIDHLVYDSFGQVASETNSAAPHLQGYAGGITDPATGLVNFWHRWYDPATGNWLSQDPLGFEAGDMNLARYVGNDATDATDWSGLFGAGSHKRTRPPTQMNPAKRNTFGGSYKFNWANGAQDFDTALQRVTDFGTFTMTDANGNTSSISWRESFLEAWTWPPNAKFLGGSVTDNHQSAPRKAAQSLARLGGFKFNTPLRGGLRAGTCGIASWDFQMTARFELVNINAPNALGWDVDEKHSGAHTFRITQRNVNVCGNGEVQRPNGNEPFTGMLFWGRGEPMPPFPANTRILRDTDTWHVHWDSVNGFTVRQYTSTGYR